jgi:hypothetical protein
VSKVEWGHAEVARGFRDRVERLVEPDRVRHCLLASSLPLGRRRPDGTPPIWPQSAFRPGACTRDLPRVSRRSSGVVSQILAFRLVAPYSSIGTLAVILIIEARVTLDDASTHIPHPRGEPHTATTTSPPEAGASKSTSFSSAFSFHELIISKDEEVHAKFGQAANLEALSQRAREVIDSFQTNVQKRSEGQGKAQSAWWDNGQPPSEIAALLSCPAADFLENSKVPMNRLLSFVKKNAKSGVIVFVRLCELEQCSLLCLKMELVKVSVAHLNLDPAASSAITVEDINDALPKADTLKKAALIPHPDGAADLRIVDDQLHEPADYWMKFLGARARPREPEIAKLAAVTLLTVASPSVPNAAALIAAELRQIEASEDSVSVRNFVHHVEVASNVTEGTFLQKMVQQEAELGSESAVVSPKAASLVQTVITLSGGVKITGSFAALEGRYEPKVAEDGNGWVLQISSATEPRVSRRRKPGPMGTRS